MAPARGDERLSGSNNNDPRTAGGRDKGRTSSAKRGAGKPKATGDVGRVLRSVYDTTLREDVPRDFLDLLGKLG